MTAKIHELEPQESSENLKISKVGQRVAEFLRQKYRKNTAKLVMRDFGFGISTAERLLRGEAPTMAQFEKMTYKYGQPFLHAVFREAHETNDERIEELRGSIFEAAKKEIMYWARFLSGLVNFRKQFELKFDPTRAALLETLVDTIQGTELSIGDDKLARPAPSET